MEITYTDEMGYDLGIYAGKYNLDMEIGLEKNFALEMPIKKVVHGMRIYIEGTEFGGIIKDITTNTANKTVKAEGDTWRKILDNQIICPEPNEDHKVVSGKIKDIISNLTDSVSELFRTGNVDGSVDNFEFPRYCTLLDGINRLLFSVGKKLTLKYLSGEPNTAGYVLIQAEDIKRLEEYSQDTGKVKFVIRDNRNGVNHLVCLGSGELQNRLVVHLYVHPDGSISEEQYYTGINEKAEKYEATAETNREELVKSGTEHLKEIMNYKSFQIYTNEDLDIGDIIAGHDYITGTYVEAEIVSKVLTATEKTKTIEIKTEGAE